MSVILELLCTVQTQYIRYASSLMYLGWLIQFTIKCIVVSTVHKLCKNLGSLWLIIMSILCVTEKTFLLVTKTSEVQNMTVKFIVG